MRLSELGSAIARCDRRRAALRGRACAAARPRAARRQDRHGRRAVVAARSARDSRRQDSGASAPRPRFARLAGPATRVVDLGGRTVIPGLIDSHLHADPRGADLQHRGQLDRRALAARSARAHRATPRKRMPPGAWLIVAGGWNELQFAERRRPTQAELEAAAPEQSRLRAARLRLGRDDRRRLREARHQQRRRPAGRRHARARRRAADGRDQRRPRRDHRAVRPAAEADVRGAGARHDASSSASSIASGSRASSIPAATTCFRPTTKPCSTSGGAASSRCAWRTA